MIKKIKPNWYKKNVKKFDPNQTTKNSSTRLQTPADGFGFGKNWNQTDPKIS